MNYGNGGASEMKIFWPTYTEGQAVIGMELIDLIDWVWESSQVLNGDAGPMGMPVFALPPVQRSAVWRPKQALDLWDSLMRGLPIGTFYLVERTADSRNVVQLATNKTVPLSGAGFDLLDGQQRVRTLLVGALGFAEEKRCLWVDLGAKAAKEGPCLRLTSKAQPFGYDAATGNKLNLRDRRNARNDIEPEPEKHPIEYADGAGGLRRAYDLELFDCPVTQDGEPIIQPPFPYEATKQQTFKLHELLGAWRKRKTHTAEGGITALRGRTGDAPNPEAVRALHEAFCKVEKAQIALLRVDPRGFRDSGQDLLALFQRIGAGGTALSLEERLYSIYKFHVPNIRDAVDEIYERVGRVLPPIKIVATALRVANARTDERWNHTPNDVDFTKAMAADPRSKLRQELEQLIPAASYDSRGAPGLFSRSFVAVKSLLSYAPDAGNFWMPDAMLNELPTELWQVLVFWAASCPDPVNPQFCRQEAVRFSLFWRLCVSNNEKAATRAFEHIKSIESKRADFPGATLYQRIVGTTGDSYAHALSPPHEFEHRLCKEATAAWRTDAERFVEDNKRNDIGSNWWWSARKMVSVR